MKKYWLLLSLLASFASVADTFFVSGRDYQNNRNWENSCPNLVCINRNWYQTPEIDFAYSYGYVVNSRAKVVETPIFLDQLRSSLQKSQGRVVIFIHGYNVDFNDGMKTLTQIDVALKLNPLKRVTSLLFDWKSQGSLNGYTADEESSRVGSLGFSYLIRTLAKEQEVKEIHIIAHSMGNRVAVDGLERASWMLKESDTGQKKLLSIAYFASDLNLEEHSAKLPRIHQQFPKLEGTVFFSQLDKALLISRTFHGGARRAGSQPSGSNICVIDVNRQVKFKKIIPSVDLSALKKSADDLLGHTYIVSHTSVVKHLQYLIFKTPFDKLDHYKALPPGDFSSVSTTLGCDEERWAVK